MKFEICLQLDKKEKERDLPLKSHKLAYNLQQRLYGEYTFFKLQLCQIFFFLIANLKSK